MSIIMTCDLDSTLADTRHRHHMIDRVNGTDWEAYARACAGDAEIEGAIALLKIVKMTNIPIHFVTGRSEVSRQETLAWLSDRDIPVAGLWMDDTPDHFEVYGSHAAYKVARILEVQAKTGSKVVLHVDDYASVAVALSQVGIPCLCVRTPHEVAELVSSSALGVPQ